MAAEEETMVVVDSEEVETTEAEETVEEDLERVAGMEVVMKEEADPGRVVATEEEVWGEVAREEVERGVEGQERGVTREAVAREMVGWVGVDWVGVGERMVATREAVVREMVTLEEEVGEAGEQEENAEEETLEMEEMEKEAPEDPIEATPGVRGEGMVATVVAAETGPTLCNCVDPVYSRTRYHVNHRTSM